MVNPTDSDMQSLSIVRNTKIGLFHLGSGMADVLTTGVWNRIMIADLGFQATPIGLLVSLRYFLAPLGIWAGNQSDRHAVLGYRRLFWIWLGRLMMVISMIGLGVITAVFARGADPTIALWGLLSLALLLFSLGNAFSGSTFLALVYDRAPEHQRGRAVGIVWTFLLTGFALGGVLFGVLLPSNTGLPTAPGELQFTAGTVQNLFVIAGMVIGSLWFFSLLGEEKRSHGAVQTDATSEHSASVWQNLRLAFQQRQMRMFMGYLGLSMLFAFSQDLILEPYAAEVFNMSPSVTTRFAAYWGTTAILSTLLFLVLSRRFRALTSTRVSAGGVLVLVIAFAVFAYAGVANLAALMMPGLLVLGVGLGIWNIGTLAMMMEMSPNGKAGTFLGFWTLLVTLARGAGVSGGGILHDVVYVLTADVMLAYVMVFALGAVGLLAAFAFLLQTNTAAFRQTYAVDSAQMMAAGLD